MEKPNPKGHKSKIVKKLTEHNPVGMFALFARSPSGTRAQFRAVFSTEEEALDVSREYCASLAAAGHPDFTYYVVEIKSRMGIEGGKYVA